MSVRIVGLRRYPVKAMGGEPLRRVTLDARGITGDRWYAVRDADGKFASGKNTRRFRRYDKVFEFSAATGPQGVVISDATGRWRVGDPQLDAELSARFGVEVTVCPERSISHQDMGAVSLIGTATLAWCAKEWGVSADPRRLRVNMVVSTTEPFAEEGWIEQTLRSGTATLRIVERIPRCRTIDLKQDGAIARGAWLKPVARERGMLLGVYATVLTPGVLSIGDELAATSA